MQNLLKYFLIPFDNFEKDKKRGHCLGSVYSNYIHWMETYGMKLAKKWLFYSSKESDLTFGCFMSALASGIITNFLKKTNKKTKWKMTAMPW